MQHGSVEDACLDLPNGCQEYRLDHLQRRDGHLNQTAHNAAVDHGMGQITTPDITVKWTEPHPHRVLPMMGVGTRQDMNNLAGNSSPILPLHEVKGISGLKKVIRATQRRLGILRKCKSRMPRLEDRAQLGGVEYKAISFMCILVPVYFFSFLVLGLVGMGTWMEVNRSYIARDNGLSPFFTGTFFAVSAFVNSGMALLDANMTALQTE